MHISEFKEFCIKMFALKNECSELGKVKAEKEKELKKMKSQCVEFLEAEGLQNFDTGEGKVIKTTRRQVKILDKHQFYDWLKSKGRFEDTVTISVATATKLFNEEFDIAKENKDTSFLSDGIPGLSEPNNFVDVTLKGS